MNSLKRALTSWPPILWPVMTFGSLLIMVGSSGRVDPPLVIAGGRVGTGGMWGVAVPGAQGVA
jgi:hypothetical protein